MRWTHTRLAVFAVACLAMTLRADEANLDTAETVIKAWAATFIENDAERIMAFYERSQDTECIVSAGERLQGFDAIHAEYRRAHAEVRFLSSTVNVVQSRTLGDTALVTFEHVWMAERLSDGSRWQGHVRTTSVLRQIEHKWTIVSEHSSPIRNFEPRTRIDD